MHKQDCLLTYRNEYTFDGVEYAPLMYKIFMRLATINSVATTQMLRNNLQPLGRFAAMVSSNINKIHSKFDKNYSPLIARGATIDNPIGILFNAYLVVPCHHFKSYIRQEHEDYLDSKLTTIIHEALMTSAKCKFDWLKTKGLWGANSPDNEKIVVMIATLNVLKGQLKLDPKLSAIVNEGREKGNKRDKKKNKKKSYNRRKQKKDGMEPGRKSHQRTVKSARKKWASTLTTGATTTWRGPCTSSPTASWVNSTSKIRGRSLRKPTPLPLLLLLQRQ
jgi:hypothetical protein